LGIVRGRLTMRAWLLNMLPVLAITLAATGCVSPHGGPILPFAGEPKPQIYRGGDGRSPETALHVRHVNDRDLPYLEESWASYYRYRTSQALPPQWEDFHHHVNRATERIDGRIYHVLTFADADGKPQVVYFDVTRVVHD